MSALQETNRPIPFTAYLDSIWKNFSPTPLQKKLSPEEFLTELMLTGTPMPNMKRTRIYRETKEKVPDDMLTALFIQGQTIHPLALEEGELDPDYAEDPPENQYYTSAFTKEEYKLSKMTWMNSMLWHERSLESKEKVSSLVHIRRAEIISMLV